MDYENVVQTIMNDPTIHKTVQAAAIRAYLLNDKEAADAFIRAMPATEHHQNLANKMIEIKNGRR